MKNLIELTSLEAKRINGGTEPHSTNVYDDGTGGGCIPPFFPQFPKPFPGGEPILF
ncbi:hypothetical protein IWQ47_004336 [Aquimarina sp. EL_43]|uniref:hypothetical protein n=1 Tax=Aquimarina TaxID=290174 RepID=UPI0004AF85EB|nr:MULTISPECIES: hypothetical protein [Aquimarina]MBG6132834.1 hypothetical protein [Aquimarina sp. EL_35]MBG6153089.1 hypothetical protein [Aquimarina sp. EL_32]MBG6171245.1 hypothetical protein [Aquimarina sp. EL_43]